MNTKQITILRLLYQNKNHFITAQEIAYEIDISDRTARKYVGVVNEVVQENGANIEAKRGQGYRLLIEEANVFHIFYRNVCNPMQAEKKVIPIQDLGERQYYILKQLLLEGNSALVEDLADNLFVSRSTISNVLVEIKKILKPYDLSLESKPNRGLYILGKEQAKRHFIMEYFFMNKLSDNIHAFSLYTSLLEEVNIAEILMIVLDECRESQLQLSDFVIYNIVLHIGLAIKRIHSGFEMDAIEIYGDKDSIQYKTANRIIERITESLEIEFPEEEANYIALHLTNKVTTEKIYQKTQFNEQGIKKQLIQALTQMDKKTGMEMANDHILIDGLMTHFTPMLVRLQNNTDHINPLLFEVKEKHHQVLRWVLEFISLMPVFQNYSVSESEWAYVAIHILAAIERFVNKQKVHALVICATGLGSSQMLKMRLENEFGSKIVIEQVISYYEITNEKLEGIDLIISSINLSNVVFNIPVVHVSVFLGSADIQKINSVLSQHKGLATIKNTPQLQSYQMKEVFNTFFRHDLFLYLDHSTDKKAIIDQLISLVEKVEKRPIYNELSAQLKLRESFSSVAFSKYLAVPHPIEGVTNSQYVAVAIIPSKVEWDETHQDIQLVFMLVPDRFQSAGLEVISRSLTAVLEDDSLRQELVNCTTFEEFSQTFMKVLAYNH